MYTVYVRLARNASSEQREAELESQFNVGRKDPLNQRALLEGEEKTPWPLWLGKILSRYGFLYDHYNWLYVRSCGTEDETIRVQAWVLWLSRFLSSSSFLDRLRLIWRMRSPGLWPWLFGEPSQDRAAMALRLDPTILQEVELGTGGGSGDEGVTV